MNKTIKYTLNEYRQNYEELLAEYLSNYFDVNETDFIESEISTYRICLDVAIYVDKNYVEFISSYNDENSKYPTPKKFQIISTEYSNFSFDIIAKRITSSRNSSYDHSITQHILSFNKIIDFLTTKKAVGITSTSQTFNDPEYTLQWIGDQTSFIELVKALIVNGNIKINKGEQAKAIETLSKFLNFKINNPNKLISDLKKRNNGSETLFLDELKKALLNHIKFEKKK